MLDGPVRSIYGGDIYRYAGDYDRALSDYNKALSLLPTSIPAYVGLGLTYEKMGDRFRARIEFQKALSPTNEDRATDSARSLETATARLAAFDSGAAQPTIAPVPIKATSTTSIPTPTAPVPLAVQAKLKPIGRRVALVFGNSVLSEGPGIIESQA